MSVVAAVNSQFELAEDQDRLLPAGNLVARFNRLYANAAHLS
jgi:hypothetical protein